MNLKKTIICVKSPIIYRGIAYCIHSIQPGIELEHYNNIDKLLKDDNHEDKLFILDINLLPDPAFYFLERMFVNFQDLTLIALSERFLSDKLAVYFRGSILITDSEEIVKNKLKNIIDTGKEINRTNRKNSAISEREQEVLRLVAFGFTNKQISDQLYISTHTVITHRKNISSKLGIKTIAGLTVYAIINGIISPDEML